MKLLHFLQLLCCFYLATLGQCLSNERLLKEAKKGRNNVIKLTDKNYKRVLQGARDSYLVVFLTATQDSIGCSLCQAMEPEYDILAESWFKTHPKGENTLKNDGDKKGLFFAKADFSAGDNHEVFQHFQAQQVPMMVVFSPTQDTSLQTINTFQQINIPAQAQPGDPRIQMLINSFQHYFELENYVIYKPVNYGSKIVTGLSCLASIFLLRKFKTIVSQIVFSKTLWGLTSCLFITVMCNGYMFNKIRKTPYAGNGGSNGQVQYFQPGMQTQYAIETQIVTFLYGTLGLLTLFLIKFVPKISNYYENKKQFYNSALSYMLTAGVLLFLIFFFSSGLMFVFRMKYPQYPFKLLK
ncbi:hypothetical protein ACO0RG_001039 [Hanseniaspora osmophila]|uniref:Dolichyl-diphosphooligosaccharide--protein glycosyltransferase subunit 3 n=1 Tax=Hanseniaspora osmophila TaxID=56408 RepID=A0A1E5RP39_9ASCO|nr:Dolichyl-diphosphooligosaccharide--protein glycosyltransferase subunit 3 [Hanseniaspora osmophila]